MSTTQTEADEIMLAKVAKFIGVCRHLETVIERWEDGNDSGSDISCKACGTSNYHNRWNSLSNNTDALNLAVHMAQTTKRVVAISIGDQSACEFNYASGSDMASNTRRAITLAAYELANGSNCHD